MAFNSVCHIEWGAIDLSQVWSECRGYAVEFLKEAREGVGKFTELFDDTLACYSEVSANLKQVAELFPFPPKEELKNSEHVNTAIAHLKSARLAEENGLQALRSLIGAL